MPLLVGAAYATNDGIRSLDVNRGFYISAPKKLHHHNHPQTPLTQNGPIAPPRFPSPLIAGDRKLRRKDIHVTCADVRTDTVFGFVVALGTDKGEVVVVDAATLTDVKTIKTADQTSTGSAAVARRPAGAGAGPSPASKARAASGGGANEVGVGGGPPFQTSCVSIITRTILLSGHNDGVVRAVNLSTGAILRTYVPPPPSAAPPPLPSTPGTPGGAAPPPATPPPTPTIATTTTGTTSSSPGGKNASAGAGTTIANPRAVVCMAAYGSEPTLLAVGRKDGTVDKYDLATGRFLVSFRTEPGLACLLSLRKFGCLASVHDGKNKMTIWDAAADRTVQVRCLFV
jgi:hypothetical protein